MLPPTHRGSVAGPIPALAGIGLRSAHYQHLLQTLPDIGWLEVHSENYFGAGGPPLFYLEQARAHYPLSLHGVGLSLGSVDPLSTDHLHKLSGLIDRFQPALVSEHLSWGSVTGRFLNDLLPLPYTEEALDHMVGRVEQVQDFLGRQILVENVSSYLQFADSTIPEPEFLAEVARRSGCGILLDVNNVYVSATNHGFDAIDYLDSIPAAAVQEIHLAGYTVNRFEDGEVLIDTHSRPVSAPVWLLYRRALERLGPTPTLIEWDADLPPLAGLVNEARRADRFLEEHRALAA